MAQSNLNYSPSIVPAPVVLASQQVFAIAYGCNYDHPALRSFANWINAQSGGMVSTATRGRPPIAGTVPARSGAMTGSATATFDEAVLAAVTSSPNGVPVAELSEILRQYGKTSSQIGAALARQAKLKTIEKKGNLWFATAATSNGKIDRSMPGRRRARTTSATGTKRGRPRRAAGATAQGAAE